MLFTLVEYAKMLDHIMIKVKDWKRAKAYYETTLKHLGYELFWDSENAGGFQGPDAPHGRIYIKQGIYDSPLALPQPYPSRIIADNNPCAKSLRCSCCQL